MTWLKTGNSPGARTLPATMVRGLFRLKPIPRLALALAAAATAGTAARAQDVPEVISPLRVESDHNGVNLVSGRTQIRVPTLSAPGAPNLRFDRVQNAAPYVSGKQWGAAGEYPQSSYSVHTGTGSSESFQCVDFDCTSVTGTGSTFIPNSNIFRQAGTGARWQFNRKHVETTTTNPVSLLYYASSVSYPNGEVITYTYATAALPGDTFGRTFYRPTRLTSNLGYYITISYQPGELGTMEWNSVSQAAMYREAGTTDVLIGRLSYSGNTITDLGGRIFTCTGCANSLGSNLETAAGSLQLPGEASPTLQTAASTQSGMSTVNPIVGSVTRDGVTWTYTYANLRYDITSRGHWYDRLTVTGPEGYSQAYNMQVSDQRNVMTGMIDSIGRTTTLEFDPSYRPTRIVSPEGNEVRAAYDEYGNLVSRTTRAKPGSGLPDTVETAFYPGTSLPSLCTVACWRPTWSRDGLNRQTDFVYNSNGQLTEQTDPADAGGVRRRTIIEYAPSASGVSRRSVVRVCGTGAACGTGAEIRTEYEYLDNTLLPTVERRIAGGVTLTTTHTYDAAGNLLSTDGPLPGSDDTIQYRYDVHGRRVREVGPLAANGLRIVQLHHYRTADDKVFRTETGTLVDPDDVPTELRQVDYGYDARRNRNRETVTSTNSAGTTIYHTVIQSTFDDRNRVECEARRMNPAQLATGQLPASACDRDSTGSFGFDRISRHSYDAAGQLTRVQRGYDTPLLQDYARYSYSLNGQRTRVTDANGNRADLRYDGFDRLSRWVFPSATAQGFVDESDYEEYRYDAVGNRTWVRKRDGSVLTYQYDALDRRIRKTVPDRADLAATHERDVFYEYNVRDLMTDARFDNWSGEGVGYNYDGFGRMISSSLNMDGVTRRFDYGWDAAGNRTSIQYPSNLDITYAYDPAGRLTSITDADAAEQLFGFTWDGLGRVDIRTDAGAGGVDHGHDRADRLTSMAHTFTGGTDNVTYGFTYNPASQIATRTRSNDNYASTSAYNVDRDYSVNGLNQYTAAASTTFAYDANGNLTRSGSTTYTYDVENRLVGASGGLSLRYDPLGRLYEVTGASGTRRFIWDGDALAAEYQTTGALAAQFVHGAGSGDDPLLWRGGGENRRLRADHQGSIIAITNDAGTPQWINGYDPWGIPNADNGGRFQYTGQIWLGDFGLYHYKGRIYSPTLGRFLQTDPVGYDDQINLYAYVGNDPVNRTDPTGMCGTRIPNAISASCSGATILGLIARTGPRQPKVPITIVSGAGAPDEDKLTGEDYLEPDEEEGVVITGQRRHPSLVSQAPRAVLWLASGQRQDPPRRRQNPFRGMLRGRLPRHPNQVILEEIWNFLRDRIPWARSESIEEANRNYKRDLELLERRKPPADPDRCRACEGLVM